LLTFVIVTPFYGSLSEKVAAERGEKQWGLTFFRKPVKFNGNSCSGQRDISSVTMEVNKVS